MFAKMPLVDWGQTLQTIQFNVLEDASGDWKEFNNIMTKTMGSKRSLVDTVYALLPGADPGSTVGGCLGY